MEPKALARCSLQFEQLKEKLRREGLFDPEHKSHSLFAGKNRDRHLAYRGGNQGSPQVIGRRFPPMDILISPVRVQGEGAARK